MVAIEQKYPDLSGNNDLIYRLKMVYLSSFDKKDR